MRNLVKAAWPSLTARRSPFKGQSFFAELVKGKRLRMLELTQEQRALMAEVTLFVTKNNFEIYKKQSPSVVRNVQDVDAYMKSQNDAYHAQPVMVRRTAEEGNFDILAYARIGDPDDFDNHYIVLAKVRSGHLEAPQKKSMAEFVQMTKEDIPYTKDPVPLTKSSTLTEMVLTP